MTYNTTGIILKYRDIGEFDRIYSILTVDHGKVEAWAQSVRKSKSKLAAHLQPLYLCDFMFARGRRFDRIAQVDVLNRYKESWSDLEAMGHAVYAATLVDLVLRPGTKEKNVFGLLLQYLEAWNNYRATGRPDRNTLTIFILKLLQESGFAPELHSCVLCKAKVTDLAMSFDAIRGGVLCKDCFRKFGSESFPVSSLTIDTLDQAMASPFTKLEMPDIVCKELNTIGKTMIAAHFGEEPKARIFVDRIGKELYAGAMV